MQRERGEVVISLFNQEALKSKGMEFYQSIAELAGEPDFEATDFDNGVFRSKTGYVSKWWTPQDREGIRTILGGQEVRGLETDDISIIHTIFHLGGGLGRAPGENLDYSKVRC